MTLGGKILKCDLPHSRCQKNAEEKISIAIQGLPHLLTLQCTAAGEMRSLSTSIPSCFAKYVRACDSAFDSCSDYLRWAM